MKNRPFLALGALLLCLAVGLSTDIPAVRSAPGDIQDPAELPVGTYFTILDDNNQAIAYTCITVMVGDQYQTSDNRLYEVTRVEGHNAYARFKGYENVELSVEGSLVAPPGQKKVAIYHSHSDESYDPTDGTSSIEGNGGIYAVGSSFGDALQRNGVQVEHSFAKHDPHDNSAYTRSRQTARELLNKGPQAIFDVHRDAVPPEVYADTVAGEDVTKIQLVVGQQNPNQSATKQFAQELKAAADKKYPGLVKGIFYGHGGYNQDLTPRAMLIEVGSNTNSRTEAERGVGLFGNVVAGYIGGTGPTGTTGQARESRRSSSTAIWVLGIVAAAVVVFFVISSGGRTQIRERLKSFGSHELSGSAGLGIGKNKRHDKRSNSRDGGGGDDGSVD
jgi:stage II sporulation protein P